jgi:hypothetical protein
MVMIEKRYLDNDNGQDENAAQDQGSQHALSPQTKPRESAAPLRNRRIA